MSAVAAHPAGHRNYPGDPTQERGLARELGLDGMPTQSLVEFEGGGSMLSREVLGEMLAINQRGILNAREGVARMSRCSAATGARRQRDGTHNVRNWAQGYDGGTNERGEQARLLCQADALKWLRESSSTSVAFARTRYPSMDAGKSTKRAHTNSGEWGGQQRGRPDEQALLAAPSPRKKLSAFGGSGVDHQAAMASITFEASRTSGSPNKRRRHRLYDHDHNPRVLRTLVDDTIITGIAGGGTLEAQEGRQVEELRQQLRLACHRATELEDLIFQSQTGAPHRQLLGELHLHRADQAGVSLLERPSRNERHVDPAPTRGRVVATTEKDFLKRCRTPDNAGGRGATRQPCRASPGKKRREPLDVSFPSTRKSSEVQRFHGNSDGTAAKDAEDSPKRRPKTPYEAMANCCPPLSPPLTPAGSLRRFLSSLRPFSADSARAAWGLAKPADGGSLEGPGMGHGHFHGDSADSFGSGQARWPVLFVMGTSKPPPPRHPLSVHALPLFDEDMVTLLAEGAGEPAERVRAMVKVITRFDFGLLTSAVRRLCYAYARDGAGTSPALKGGRRNHHAARRKVAPGPAVHAWAKHDDDASPFPAAALTGVDAVGPSNGAGGQAKRDDEPLLMSDAAAGRALAGGFLSGVFGENAVRDIVVASRPVVVFDSTGSAEGDGAAGSPPTMKAVVCTDYRSKGGMKSVLCPTKVDNDAGDKYFRGGEEDDATSTATARGNKPSSLPSEKRREPEPLSEASPNDTSRDVDQPNGSRTCVEGDDLLDANTSRPAPIHRAPGERRAAWASNSHDKDGDGVLVAQLVRAAAARFRVHSLAVRHREIGNREDQAADACSSHLSTLSCSRGGDFGRGIFIGGSGGSGWTETDYGQERKSRRPASADSDELGLPPLKLIKRDKASGRKRVAGGRRREKEGEEAAEMEVDVFGVPRPRSTPRCLRPGYKGEVTAAMLRQELEASETTAARLGITMARKAEAWKLEAQEGGGVTTATTAAANRAALALASTRARDALLDAARERMREAANIMYLGIVRRGWRAWTELVRRQQSLDAAGRVARLAGAAALGFGVIEPLLRRRMRAWLRRWAGAMRAERVLEVQAAAVELQRAARGFLGRGRAREKRRSRAAVAVQRVARGRAGRLRGARRARMMRERRAVRTIEQKYREFVWQRNAVKLLALKKRHRAATKVQAAWRGEAYGRRPAWRLRQLRREEVSTVMLQRLWRGVVARARADVLLEGKFRREAAVRIQAAGRGRGARNVYRPIILRERAASTMSRFWRCARARRLAQRNRASNVLAARLNPLVRGFLGRRATKVLFEEHRRKHRAMLLVCVASQKMFRGKQGRVKARRELLRRCAAVELQRMVRGRAIRRLSQVEEGRPQSLASSWMAAVAVQRVWRGQRGQRKLGQRAAEKRTWDAAFTIQSAYRRLQLRRRRRAQAERRTIDTSAGAAARHGDLLKEDERKTEAARRAPATGGGRESGGGADDSSRDPAGSVAAAGAPRDTSETAAVDTHPSGAGSTAAGGTPAGAADGGLPVREPLPQFSDIGDVALAAVQSAKQPSPPLPSPLPPQPPVPAPAVVVVEQPAPVVLPTARAAAPPAPEETLEYYQAKLRYLAAQEKAHGGSAVRIQCMFRAFTARQQLIPLRAERDKRERRLAEELRAALVLQSASRTRAARRAVARRRAEISEAARREEGLLTIQCAVRCFLGKCRLRALIEAEKARQNRRYRMAARIQARVRGIQTRDVWRKFFNSRALLQRERQRKGAQQIQSSWRSTLARTEAERRRSARDAALLAEQLERHLKGLLESTMEAERRHAYTIRLQCWWRGILAVRLKIRRRLLLKEVPLEDVEQEAEKAALVLQCHWRAIKARRSYNANYARLYRERERRKCCTECQSQYATRQCDTCLDKFCDGCWARIHSTGARRFHDWRPFAPASYDAFHPSHDTAAAGYTIPSATTTTDGSISSSYYYNADRREAGQWATDPNFPSPPAATDLTSYDGYESYDYHGSSEYYYGGGDDQQQQGAGVQNWSLETNQQLWYDPNQYGGDYYQDGGGGAESYDGAAAAAAAASAASAYYPAWTPDTPPTVGSADGEYEHGSNASKSGGQRVTDDYGYDYSYNGGTPETADYYGYDAGASATGTPEWAKAGGAATGWEEGWATPQTTEISASTLSGTEAATSEGFVASPAAASGPVEGSTTGTPPSGSGGSSRRPWSVNEYGQRVAGDWVEYWDDAAQAAYFYNTATGEASWTEPATG